MKAVTYPKADTALTQTTYGGCKMTDEDERERLAKALAAFKEAGRHEQYLWRLWRKKKMEKRDRNPRYFKGKVRRDRATGCWIWTGGTCTSGRYGWHSSQRMAHRVAYELFVGPIPDGLVIDHLCRNTLCVNPSHLEPVTYAENLRRGRE